MKLMNYFLNLLDFYCFDFCFVLFILVEYGLVYFFLDLL